MNLLNKNPNDCTCPAAESEPILRDLSSVIAPRRIKLNLTVYC
jgi:hypothetical protein